MSSVRAGRSRGRRITIAAAMAISIVSIWVPPAVADETTPRWTKRWNAGDTATYKFKVSEDSTQTPVPDWLQLVMANVLTTTWADSQTNNSNGVRFTPVPANQSPDVEIRYSPHIAETQFCGDGWLGCADPTVVPKKIYIRKGPAGYKKWCDITFEAGCPDGGRAAIHEVGHIGDLGHNTTYGTWAETRMTSPGFPFNATNTWDRRTLGRCDEAALQLRYNVKDKAGGYSKCLDHIDNAVAGVGLQTDLSEGPTSATVCSGTPVTVGGRLNVHSYTAYGPMKDNNLWQRVLTLKRNGLTQTPITTDSTSGDNWSRTLTVNTSVTLTYSYTVQYLAPSAEGLASSPIRAFSVTWVEPADC